jgi:hypothetical protein
VSHHISMITSCSYLSDNTDISKVDYELMIQPRGFSAQRSARYEQARNEELVIIHSHYNDFVKKKFQVMLSTANYYCLELHVPRQFTSICESHVDS